MVVTGGLAGLSYEGIARVQEYTLNTTERLPDLNKPRFSHACGYYRNSMNKLVSFYQHIAQLATMSSQAKW